MPIHESAPLAIFKWLREVVKEFREDKEPSSFVLPCRLRALGPPFFEECGVRYRVHNPLGNTREFGVLVGCVLAHRSAI